MFSGVGALLSAQSTAQIILYDLNSLPTRSGALIPLRLYNYWCRFRKDYSLFMRTANHAQKKSPCAEGSGSGLHVKGFGVIQLEEQK